MLRREETAYYLFTQGYHPAEIARRVGYTHPKNALCAIERYAKKVPPPEDLDLERQRAREQADNIFRDMVELEREVRAIHEKALELEAGAETDAKGELDVKTKRRLKRELLTHMGRFALMSLVSERKLDVLRYKAMLLVLPQAEPSAAEEEEPVRPETRQRVREGVRNKESALKERTAVIDAGESHVAGE